MAIDLDVHGNTKPLEAAVQAAVNRIRRQPIKITVDDKGATQPLGNMKRGADEFTKSMEAANARILAFGASMAIINGVANAFKGMVKNLVEVEKSLADINVVMGLSAQNLDKFSDGLFKVAKETGAAFKVAADAATEYARQGLGVEESLKRTRDALVLTRLTGMDSAEAVKSLTAAMNTYGNQIKDTTQLVSKFAAVDVKFAVSAEDFADAISRTGQSAKTAGVSIDELVGIVTSAQQQTARGGAVIGNALKTIFTKTGRTDTLNQLENLGIAVRDLEGNTIGAKRILSDLANTFDKLSEAQKSQITQTMGGLFHINILKAVLSDAAKQNGIMAEATRISAGATDEAIEKNEELRKTMSAVATETGLAIKQVSAQMGEIAIAPGMEKILNTVKSLAEGLSGVLGDGESTGGNFATGFLKGIGNVITGPGLVVLAGVFFKLFGQALKFTKESLTSLVGVTTEKQKQKAIQASLVSLFGQSAALNKEMLRTDIGRTEKEKIILGLLKAQVLEAKSLNTLTAGMAGTLYRKGYGANLTPVGKKASGHIPNYANPERAQAAQGGYAAGNIRSMNMPGEGSVIYNSAEKVKNFKGMSQPAIMPPQSSKAGKNYQQAFGNIHGFDPYAAGGFVPNFNKRSGKKLGTAPIPKNLNSKELGTLNEDSSLILLTADSSTADSKSKFFIGKDPRGDTKILNTSDLASKRTTGYYGVNVPYYSIDKKDKTKAGKEDLPAIQKAIRGAAINKALDIATAIVGGKKNLRPYNKEQIEKTFNDGAFKAASGSTFESAIAAALKSHLFQDYQARTDTSAIDLPYDPRLFAYFGAPAGAGKMGAEVKADLANKLQQGAAKKFYEVLAGGRAAWEYKDKDYKDKTGGRAAYAGLERRGSGYFKKRKAYGHIPNFADPLSDAIGREKAAGVPVSQIRVGSHGALMGKGNPLGLGVTNTHDEPNGLRDVFGANGFVPNYFNPLDSIKSSIANTKFGQNWEKATTEHTKKIEKLNRRIEQREQAIQKHNRELSTLTRGTSEYRVVQSQLKSTTSNLDKTRAKLNVLEKSSATGIGGKMGRLSSGLGRAFSGNTGMAMMMGAPMAAGFLQQGGMGAQGGNQSMYAAGGALTGAASGAMMASMIAPMFGPGAPLVIALGGAVGAYQGWASATEENTKALKDAESKRQQQVISSFVGTSPKFMQTFSKNIFDDMSEESRQVMKMAAPKYTATTPPDISEKDFLMRGPNNPIFKMKIPLISDFFGPSAGEIDQIAEYREQGDEQNEFQKIQKYQVGHMKKALSSMGDEEFLLPSYIKDKKGKIQKQDQPERQKASDFLKNLEKIGFFKATDTKDVKRIEGLRSQLYKIYQDRVTSEDEQSDAIILQLNLQKAQIQAQKASADAQFEIKSQYIQQSNMLQMQEKLMGVFISDKQKAENKYTGALNKAANAYNEGAETAKLNLKTGIMQDIMQNSTLEQALKQELFKGKEAKDVTKVDLTNKLAEMDDKKLIATLRSLKVSEGEINDIIQNRSLLYDNQITALERQRSLSLSQAANEKQINLVLAERKKLLDDMVDRMEDFASRSQFLSDKGGLEQRISAAQRQGTGYISADRQLQTQRSNMEKYVIPELRRQGRGKKESILKGVGVGFNEDEQKEIIAMRGQGLDIASVVKAQRGREFKEKGGSAKMLELQQFVDDPFNAFGEGRTEAQVKEYAEKEAKLNELKTLDAERNKLSDDLNKKISDANTALERANVLNKKNVDAVKEEQAARERMRARMTEPGAFSRGFKDVQGEMFDSVQTFNYQLGDVVATNFRDGIAEAMKVGLSGAEDMDEALTQVATNFLSAIQSAFLQNAANAIVSAIPMPGGKSRGGSIRNYSRGGGVPAMVSNGEYVMGRDAVNKYGGSFMHGMNAGGNVPGFSNGGATGSALAANFGGGRGYDSGRAYQSKAMSGFFYSQSGNVGLGEDRESLLGVLAEEEKKRQEARAKKEKKKAFWKQLLGTALSAGISYGVGGGFSGAGKGGGLFSPKPTGTGTVLKAPSAGWNSISKGTDLVSDIGGGFNPGAMDKIFNIDSRLGPWKTNYYGGSIRKYASGGHISGKSGIDQIPAMLSEGEYVIRASSARQIGRPMLDRINAGKFNDGGAVSEIAGSSETGSTGGSTNNINISINMERGKAQQSNQDSGGQNTADRSNDEQGSAALADRIKQQVVSVIVEEQRPGGLLDEKS